MKTIDKLLSIVLLILFVQGIPAPCSAQAPAQASEARAAEAQAAQERWVAIVTSAQGGVYVQRSGQTQWAPLAVNDRCYPGDSIRVEENSRAALLFKNDSTLRIDQNSSLSFQPMEEQTVVMRLFNGAACFFSRFPRSLKIFTPHMNGTVKGTEFVIRVDGDQTQLTLYEGQVLAENGKGSLNLVSGQSVVARKDQVPALVTVVRPRDAVQWALYYPAIQDFGPADFPGEADWQAKARASAEAWRKGNVAEAIAPLKGLNDSTVADTRYLLYRASLALPVGRVDEASAYLERILKADPKNANAYALQSVIATTQNSKAAALDLATRAVSLDPQSSAARISLSYAQQARFDINGTMASVQEAVKLNASDAYARARLAELWLSQGYLNKALEAAEGAVRINPSLARTQTVLGFAYLTQVKITEARTAFEKAISLDSADPLPRLGLGLAKIRKGDLAAGRQEIEIAASLDLNSSLIRSYLGKAYYEEKRESLSASQFATAKQLDPMDPTPWFYDAILKQSVNRPVEALQDIQKSIDLNNNRAVYRSQLLLDQDIAARSASQGRIYSDLGFQNLALIEGWKSVNTDPSNFSAHRLLADVYSSLPRHEIARVSELLQSQLLQPISINPVQPQLAENNLKIFQGSGPANPSFNEYNSLFTRNQIGMQASGAWGEKNTLGDEVALNGIYNWLSVSLGQFYFKTNGFRDNNDQRQELYNLFVQATPDYKTSLQAELRYSDKNYGDLALSFDPDNYDPTARQTDRVRTGRFGFHHAFEPGSDLIASFIYARADYSLDFTSFMGPYHDESKWDSYLAEMQYLFKRDRFQATVGGGMTDVNATGSYDMTIFAPPPVNVPYDFDVHNYNVYLYTNSRFPDSMIWTLGASADFYNDTTNNIDSQQVNPKVGLTWNVLPSTTVRAAAFRTLSHTVVTSQTIEPTQVAGFNQLFNDTIGTKAWRYGAAVDQKFTKSIFGGVELSKRDLDVPFTRYTLTGFAPDYVKWHEELARVYLYWAPHPWISLSAEYQYERLKMADDFYGPYYVTKADTNRFPLGLNFFHPSGIILNLTGTYIDQDVDYYDMASGTIMPGKEGFWVFDASVGYRLPKRFGIIALEVKNLTDENFRFQDTDPANPRVYPTRVFLGKLTLSF